MADTLATQLALQMDEFRMSGARPTALFNRLILWGEAEIHERGSKSLTEVTDECTAWWTAHRPIRTGLAMDAWLDLQVAIESLLLDFAKTGKRL